MDAHGVARLCVDLKAPDFQQLASGFGCAASRVGSPHELATALANRPSGAPYLIEVDACAWQNAL